jgi:hypothetical protein
MANTLTSVIPQILLRAQDVARQNSILPRLVDNSYSTDAEEQGNSIDIAIAATATARDVAAAVTPAANQDHTMTKTTLNLNKFKESTHNLTDKEYRELVNGVIPRQGEECVKAVVNQVEADIFTEALNAGNAVGTAGTTPFGGTSSLTVAGSARRWLNFYLAPMEDRYVVLDAMAEGNAVVTPDVFRFDGAGDTFSQINGAMGRRLGMGWVLDQNVAVHTSAAAWITGFSIATAAATALSTTLTIINASVTGTLVLGDKFTIGGATQVYAIISVGTIATATATVLGNVTISIYPAVGSTVASGVAITVITSFTQNLVFQRRALAFASRRLSPAMGIAENGELRSFVDPISGLALNIAITREHYQSTFRVSCLYGIKLVRPDWLVHLLG